MKKLICLIKKSTTLITVVFILAACTIQEVEIPVSKEMVVWYNQPAGDEWHDGLLIGNGFMGANVSYNVMPMKFLC